MGSIEYDGIGDDMVNLGDVAAKSEKAGHLGSRRSMSMMTFNTIGSHYKVPTRDHRYKIKHGLPFGFEDKKPKDHSYMTQVVERAKSSVDPRKYNRQSDWGKMSRERPNLAMPKAKRVTSTEDLIVAKKKIPGPDFYKNTDPIKPKILGFYGNSEDRISIIASTMYEKKKIPGPSAYESRGKSMHQLIKENNLKNNFVPKGDDYSRTSSKINKNSVPGPTTYKVEESLLKSAKMKQNPRQIFSKA